MRCQSLSGSPSVPSSITLRDSRRLLASDEHKEEVGDADLVVRRSSSIGIGSMVLFDTVVEPAGQDVIVSLMGQGVIASISSSIIFAEV